ncbi:MAG: hypothetical protein QXM25_04250 [Nitrososphaerales archaeon]
MSIALEIETFGEYNTEDTGIFEFLKELPIEVAKKDNLKWSMPTETIRNLQPTVTIIIPEVRTISWATVKI